MKEAGTEPPHTGHEVVSSTTSQDEEVVLEDDDDEEEDWDDAVEAEELESNLEAQKFLTASLALPDCEEEEAAAGPEARPWPPVFTPPMTWPPEELSLGVFQPGFTTMAPVGPEKNVVSSHNARVH